MKRAKKAWAPQHALLSGPLFSSKSSTSNSGILNNVSTVSNPSQKLPSETKSNHSSEINATANQPANGDPIVAMIEKKPSDSKRNSSSSGEKTTTSNNKVKGEALNSKRNEYKVSLGAILKLDENLRNTDQCLSLLGASSESNNKSTDSIMKLLQIRKNIDTSLQILLGDKSLLK
jgi:hypothetical protein